MFKKYAVLASLLVALSLLTACDMFGGSSTIPEGGVKAKVTATVTESNISGTYVAMRGQDTMTLIVTGNSGRLTVQKADGSQESDTIELDVKAARLKIAGEEAEYTTTDNSITVSPKAKDYHYITETLTFAKQ